MQNKIYEIENELTDDYLKSNTRLILLDYDGTLISFTEKPEEAKPDDELLQLLKSLALDNKNDVVIISGRDKKTLEKYFGALDVHLVAEHGAWIKRKSEDWKTIRSLKNDWKEKLRPTIESFVKQTPGSFIEEKEFSLVWHYRKSNAELASVNAQRLKEALLSSTSKLGLEVMEGNKVIEVKIAGITKGQAALVWISKEKWDFILAIGDDLTDEKMFAVIPNLGYSIKVGTDSSCAGFHIESPAEVRSLLKKLEGLKR